MRVLTSVVLLLVLSCYVTVSSLEANPCERIRNGKVRHPTSCTKYYDCANYRAKVKTCKSTEHYSTKARGCAPINQSSCVITTTTLPTTTDCTPNVANLDKFIKYDHIDTTYYISKAHYSDAAESAAMCKSICGHLSEIEDTEKDELVLALLKRLNYGGVLIEGTNKYNRSKWENERTQKNVNYLSWCRGEPNNHVKDESCLTYMKNWACMWDAPCVYNYTGFDIHYLCEVNHL